MTSPALQDIVALLGCPAAGNPAQYLFERAIEATGIDCRFLTFDVPPARLADALAGISAMGFRGCLLSGPLRAAATGLVGSLTPTAAFSGGVNLVVRQEDMLVGHMTEGRGLVESLRSHADPSGAHVLLLAAGVAGRAAALELALAGAASITVCDVDAARAADLVESLIALPATARSIEWQADLAVPAETDILVSAIPAAGARPGPRLVGLRGDVVVAEMALLPAPSPLAHESGVAAACMVDGVEINGTRAAIDFHTLTGRSTDADAMRDALDEFLS